MSKMVQHTMAPTQVSFILSTRESSALVNTQSSADFAAAEVKARPRKRAKHYGENRIAFINDKFTCEPLDLLPLPHRPQKPLSETFIFHFTDIADRATTVDVARRLLKAAAQHRLKGFTVSSCRKIYIVLDDLYAVLAAAKHHFRITHIKAIDEEFRIPFPMDKYLDESCGYMSGKGATKLRTARMAKMRGIVQAQKSSAVDKKPTPAPIIKFARPKKRGPYLDPFKDYGAFHLTAHLFGGHEQLTGKVWGNFQLDEMADFFGNYDLLECFVEGTEGIEAA